MGPVVTCKLGMGLVAPWHPSWGGQWGKVGLLPMRCVTLESLAA